MQCSAWLRRTADGFSVATTAGQPSGDRLSISPEQVQRSKCLRTALDSCEEGDTVPLPLPLPMLHAWWLRFTAASDTPPHPECPEEVSDLLQVLQVRCRGKGVLQIACTAER